MRVFIYSEKLRHKEAAFSSLPEAFTQLETKLLSLNIPLSPLVKTLSNQIFQAPKIPATTNFNTEKEQHKTSLSR